MTCNLCVKKDIKNKKYVDSNYKYLEGPCYVIIPHMSTSWDLGVNCSQKRQFVKICKIWWCWMLVPLMQSKMVGTSVDFDAPKTKISVYDLDIILLIIVQHYRDTKKKPKYCN